MKSTSRFDNHLLFSLMVLLSISIVGCGGGGGSSSTSSTVPPATSKVLSWTPPETFADQTPLDPSRDLDHYEIYINETGSFAGTEPFDAVVSAVEGANGALVTSFDMANLAPFLSRNVKYFVSMKSVSVTGVKSDFSPSVSFSL